MINWMLNDVLWGVGTVDRACVLTVVFLGTGVAYWRLYIGDPLKNGGQNMPIHAFVIYLI